MKDRSYFVALAAMLIFIVSSYNVRANCHAGGELYYKYIGDSTGVNNEYLVTLILYRDGNGASFRTSQNICISSSCFSNTSMTVHKVPPLPGDSTDGDGGVFVKDLEECALSSVPLYTYTYQATTVLGGQCPDWKFSHFSFSTRNLVVQNLQLPGDEFLYVEATLNNTVGNNSSPTFISPAAKTFCINQPFNWKQKARDMDGDSLVYTLATPMGHQSASGGVSGCPFGQEYMIPFVPGFTARNPMTTANGININQRNGTFSFTPTRQEVVVLRVDVIEYRFNSVLSQWVKIGSVTRDMQVVISGQCKPSVINGPPIDITFDGFSSLSLSPGNIPDFKDSLFNHLGVAYIPQSSEQELIPSVAFDCFDTVINLRFNMQVLCESISQDGTDFRLVAPDGTAEPITGVNMACSRDSLTRQLQLLLHEPLDDNGEYLLYVKPGTDGNTLLNQCGFQLAPYFMMLVQVDDCPVPDYHLENVSVFDDQHIEIVWQIDSSFIYDPLVETHFNKWIVERAFNDTNFHEIASISGMDAIDKRFYIDSFADGYDVDHNIFQYRVRLVINQKQYDPTNFISSILLQDPLQNNEVNLEWSEFYGWKHPLYEVFYGQIDSSGGPPWVYWEKVSETFDQSYASTEEFTAYDYYVRVDAIDTATNHLISESNWIFYPKSEEPDLPSFPNVFSPNGDNHNDRFFFQSPQGSSYPEINLEIYNRWGKMVFKDTGYQNRNDELNGWDGVDMNTGEELAEGVYFYVVKLYNPMTEKEVEVNGSVTIVRGY